MIEHDEHLCPACDGPCSCKEGAARGVCEHCDEYEFLTPDDILAMKLTGALATSQNLDELPRAAVARIELLERELAAANEARKVADYEAARILVLHKAVMTDADERLDDAEARALKAAEEVREPKISVDLQGVHFGKNYWVSHETITGCEAKLIPIKHPAYWEWCLNVHALPILNAAEEMRERAAQLFEPWSENHLLADFDAAKAIRALPIEETKDD